MILPNDFSWLESYLSLDDFFYTDSLNWDQALSISLLSVFSLDFIFNSISNSSILATTFYSNFSVLDLIFFTEGDKLANYRSPFIYLIFDLSFIISILAPITNFAYLGEAQNLASLMPLVAPELYLAYQNFLIEIFLNSSFGFSEATLYDFFYDSPSLAMGEFLDSILYIYLWIWFSTLFCSFFLNQGIWNSIEVYWTRLYFYILSLSLETRMQLDMGIQLFFTFIFYWIISIATFDDDQEETTEMFNLMLIFFFAILIIFLIYKYSIHYFAFLEATDLSGRSVSFLTKQFFRDFMGTIGLGLRFFILLFRLNVYDNLDDFYDSYYIFLGDFDEIDYITDSLIPLHHFALYEKDNKSDGFFLMEEENGILFDFFYLYWVLWGKFFFFIFFIIEELFRIGLALYISYLIIFEVHSANCSYTESNYFLTVRSRGFKSGPLSFNLTKLS